MCVPHIPTKLSTIDWVFKMGIIKYAKTSNLRVFLRLSRKRQSMLLKKTVITSYVSILTFVNMIFIMLGKKIAIIKNSD